jgi:hypothetical protein
MNIIHLSSKKNFPRARPGQESICNITNPWGSDLPSGSSNLATQAALTENDICNPLLSPGRQIV